MRNSLLIALLLGMASVLHAQTSAYQDADGNSSIFLVNAKANLTFNVSASKFDVGYLYEPSAVRREQIADLTRKLDQAKTQDERDNWQSAINDLTKLHICGRCEYGINFSGKPRTDLTNQIFQSGNSPASIGGGGAFGIHGILSKDIFSQQPGDHLRDDWMLVNVTYIKSTFDTITGTSTTPVTQHFNGFTILPTYNALYNVPAFNILMGLAAGVNRTNNVDQLKNVNVTTTAAQSGTVSVVEQKSAYLGSYSTSIGTPVYSDFVFIPKRVNWIGIDAFERSNVVRDNRYAEGGLGFYLAKPNAPTQVLGGISIGWKDGNRTIALVAGWSF